MIPLLHDFTGATVLVFGGGTVGARKARKFAREARVVVVSPTFADADFGDAELVRAAPEGEAIEALVGRAEPALVVAATDDGGRNEEIEQAAREHGALVNRTDQHGERDHRSVVVPATVRDHPVVAAIATGGTSPALSRYLRERLEEELENAGEMARLTGDMRDELQERDMEPTARRDAVRAVVRSERVWKHLDSGRTNARQVAEDVTTDVTGDTS